MDQDEEWLEKGDMVLTEEEGESLSWSLCCHALSDSSVCI